MKKSKFIKDLLVSFALVVMISNFLIAQDSNGLRSISEIEQAVMPPLNNEVLIENEIANRQPQRAPHFAKNIEVLINPETHGQWEKGNNGMDYWRLRIYSRGAKSLNLGFSSYHMPEGASMILYPINSSDDFIGPFTISDNEDHDQLWTPLVTGEELVIEVQCPPSKRNALQLELSSVNHDFIGFNPIQLKSGSCNLDVICGAQDGWGIVDKYRENIRSVARMTGSGIFSCTGFLINNVKNDCRPFFITAEHCGLAPEDAPSLVVYWNFENSFCRQPDSQESGEAGDGLMNSFNSGSIFRAAWEDADFTLVELDDPIVESAQAFLPGWSIEMVAPQDTVFAVHHPSTDEKRISFEFDPTQPGGENNQVVDIADAKNILIEDWDVGTTEGGSSGSPLFNNNKQIVGHLRGGSAACGNDFGDIYGWLRTSWFGGGTPSTALRFWLDPDDTGVESIAGRDCNFLLEASPSQISLCSLQDVDYNVTIPHGYLSEVTLTAKNLPTGATYSFTPNPAAPGEVSQLSITTLDNAAIGIYEIGISAENGTDEGSGTLTLGILETPSTPIGLTLPLDDSKDLDVNPRFDWEVDSIASTYEIQISKESTFTDLVHQATDLTELTYAGASLESLTTYYWRVRAINLCGAGPWSSSRTFQTASCLAELATDTPLDINAMGRDTVISTLTITETGIISGLRLQDLDIPHTYVSDLVAFLESPTGTIIKLFDQPGYDGNSGGCGRDNILASFHDTAANTAEDFENSCEEGAFAISGEFQSIDPLSTFVNEDPNGMWTLTVIDVAGGDGGTINNWSLNICLFDDSSSTSDLSPEYNYSFAPNPTSGFTEVKFNQFLKEDIQLRIYTIEGQLMFEKLLAKNQKSISLDLSDFASGIYLAQIVIKDQILTKRISLIR